MRITFYHQARFDGGRRTGISVDDDDALHYFEPGDEGDHDPRLLWYVDVRCEGDKLPAQPRQVPEWFVNNEAFFVEGLRRTAADIELGLDAELWPFHRQLADGPQGARCSVVVLAVRRLSGREMAANIRALAENWKPILERLAVLEVR